MTPRFEFWVVEFNNTPQFGNSDQYYAQEQADENFGDTLDANGNKARVVRYIPADDASPIFNRATYAAMKAYGRKDE